MKRTITTSNEFVYEVLNNMVHYNQIVLFKKDLVNSRALRYAVNKLKDTFKITDRGEELILTKTKRFDVNLKFSRKL